jgi:hypothetical protein
MTFSKNLAVIARSLGKFTRQVIENADRHARVALEVAIAFSVFVKDMLSIYHRGQSVEMVLLQFLAHHS